MSVDVQAEITIDRPRSVVADVVFNPKLDKLWVGGLTNVFPLTSGPLAAGSKFERMGVFLNRQYSGVYFVTRAETGVFAEMTSDEPMPLRLRYDLDETGEGTIVRVRWQSFGETRYNVPATLLNRSVSEKLADDLRKLKRYIESNHE